MDTRIVHAYKQQCFQGRGIVALWSDRTFFSALTGVCLYIWRRRLIASLLLFAAVFALLTVWDMRRWSRFKRNLLRNAVDRLKREDWMDREAERIRQKGGVTLFPTPDTDSMTGCCLRLGRGTSFHCFGEVKTELIAGAAAYGCTVTFHPWGEGAGPSREQVIQRLERDAPKRDTKLLRRLLSLPGSRYLVTGCMLLLLSIVLRHALYWRLLGSLCLLIGAVRRSVRLVAKT